MPILPPDETVALIVATSFAAGLNVPATTATLGLLAHAGLITLPPSLQPLASWWVIGASGVFFAIELVVDKIPGFDLLWNALQTFIRVPAGGLLAYGAALHLSPAMQLVAAALGAAIALAAHGGKTVARAAATASPEPFSNIALSLGEDALAIFITWLATRHPFWAAAIVVGFLVAIAVLVRWVVRASGALYRGAMNPAHEGHPDRRHKSLQKPTNP